MVARQLAFLFLAVTANAAFGQKPLAPATIVVFNQDLPESVELAKFYAQKRGIARDHLVGLSVSKTEEISRLEYDTMIRDPLRDIFKERNWWTVNESRGHPSVVTNSSIRFVALMKGM